MTWFNIWCWKLLAKLVFYDFKSNNKYRVYQEFRSNCWNRKRLYIFAGQICYHYLGPIGNPPLILHSNEFFQKSADSAIISSPIKSFQPNLIPKSQPRHNLIVQAYLYKKGGFLYKPTHCQNHRTIKKHNTRMSLYCWGDLH